MSELNKLFSKKPNHRLTQERSQDVGMIIAYIHPSLLPKPNQRTTTMQMEEEIYSISAQDRQRIIG